MTEKKPGDRFTADKFRWFDQITADHTLTPLCFHVAYKISRWLRPETREGWRSQEHLAQDCGVTVNGVRGALKQLCDNGHLTIIKGGGRGHASVYKFVVKPPERGNDGCTLNDEKGQQPLILSEDKGATTVHERVNNGSHKGATTVAPSPLPESFKESLEYISPQDFEEFWLNYPRRQAKKEAATAYQKARLSASHSEILLGAMKYSEARANEDARYTKLPATWLNKGCWTDEIAAEPLSEMDKTRAFLNGHDSGPERHNKKPQRKSSHQLLHEGVYGSSGPSVELKPSREFDQTAPIVDAAFTCEPVSQPRTKPKPPLGYQDQLVTALGMYSPTIRHSIGALASDEQQQAAKLLATKGNDAALAYIQERTA
jgi:hypothetical protein